MKIILHIGTPKAGSTALQFTLSNLRAELKKIGILYPTVKTHGTAHHFLATLMRLETPAPSVARNYDGKSNRLKKDIEESFLQLKREIKSNKPHTVILSSEAIFNGVNSKHAGHLKNRLLELTDDITIVACIRQPSKWYLSKVQQYLKSSGKLYNPQAVSIKKSLLSCATLFGDKVDVIKFDRDTLINHDISCEFFQRYIPEAYPLLTFETMKVENESLSAESMQILQNYRQEIHADSNNKLLPDSTFFQNILISVEKKYDLCNRPVLASDVKKYIDRSSTDFLWLQERYNIQFDDMDYSLIKEYKNNPYEDYRLISEICTVDESRQQQIMMHAIEMLLSHHRLPIPEKLIQIIRRNSGNRCVQWLRPIINKFRKRYVA